MALLIQRAINGLIPARFSRSRPPSLATTPDRILLGVRPGHRPSDKPPVRIYLGTERGQFRAERIFLWSIEKYRDPSRIYEIYLMRDIKGFKRGFWLTGFTNYRFAIPEFTSYSGRAIYNDADQIYLTDPAHLFDLDMDKAGFLSINDRDTSVMLIDCQRMAEAWNGHDVRRCSRKTLEARARQAGLWGELDSGWNARDSEHDPAHSKLVHFTTLHTQPWRPFPEQLVYFPNPTGDLWPDLEAEANSATFLPFSAKRPSRHWNLLSLQNTGTPNADKDDYSALLNPEPPAQRQPLRRIEQLLEQVPDEDVAWVLHRLMTASETLEIVIREPLSQRAGHYRRALYFWLQHFKMASAMVQDCRWRLTHYAGLWRSSTLCGGPALEGDVVALTHRKPGHDEQALTIARALAERTGRGFRSVAISAHHSLMPNALLSEIDHAAVVVASGWWPSQVARRLQQRRPTLRMVLAGRKAGPPPEQGGVVIQCRHFGLPPHPQQLVTDLPLNAGRQNDDLPSTQWQAWHSAERRVALLLGGPSRNVAFTASHAASLARQVSTWCRKQDAHLLVIGSRRSAPLLDAVRGALSEQDQLYVWQAGDADNPYPLALAHAHHLVVTADSESMLADAAHSGRPFWILDAGPMKHSLWQRIGAWVAGRATRPRFNRRGSIRPQQGLNYLCARLLSKHWVLPPRDLPGLVQRLIQSGQAAPFSEAEQQVSLAAEKRSSNWPENTRSETIDRIITLLSLHLPSDAARSNSARNQAG